jgi:hypothetical protein
MSDLVVQIGVTYRFDQSSVNWSDRCDTGLTSLQAENSDFGRFVSEKPSGQYLGLICDK